MKEVAGFACLFLVACCLSAALGIGIGQMLFSAGRLVGVYP